MNKEIHSLNGNVVIKYMNWNKGSAKLVNRIEHLQNIIHKFKPKK